MTRGLLLAAVVVVTLLAPGSQAAIRQHTVSPKLTSHSPIVGSVGATLKIVGSGLRDTSRAVFAGNVVATIASKADGEVDVLVPPMARDGSLTLTTPGGTASILFRVVPKLIGFSAGSHTVGSAVTINGSGLADATSVQINSAQASFHAVSPSEISAKVPATAYPTGQIQVKALGGQAISSGTFRVGPTISGFSPGSATTGTTIKISGTGFAPYAVVRFAGLGAQVTGSSHTAIKVTVPANAGSGLITVSTGGGIATSAGEFTVRPTITSSAPIYGSAGATVKIVGSGLGGTSLAVFAGNAAGTIVSKTHQEVDVVVPATARNGSLTLTTPGGKVSILFRVRPVVSGVSADSHTVGGIVTINGSGLADVTSVQINSAQANFHVVSPNEITAKIPADASPTGSIRVSDSYNNQATSTTYFKVLPTISGFSPASAPDGTTIRISGTGFWPGYTAVRFPGGSTGQITDMSHTAINVIVPFAARTGPITVTTTGGGSATSAGIFTSIGSPDFRLTAGPASQTVTRGGQTTYTVYITPSHGFSGPVQLSLSGSPLGTGHRPLLVSTFSPNPAAVGTSSTLTVKTDARMAKGTSILTITGSSGSQSHSVQVSLAVQ